MKPRLPKPGPKRTSVSGGEPVRDEGAVLILALVTIIIATLIVIPVLKYATAVTRASRVVDQRVQRLEAVKAGLRTALANPTGLFTTCGAAYAGVNNGRILAGPQLTVPVQTTCYLMNQNFTEDPTKRPLGLAAVQVGATLPSTFTSTVPARTDLYGGTGADPTTWRTTNASVTRAQGTIWTPNLPGHAYLSHRSPTPYTMTSDAGTSCLVYFPGSYVDPITINGPTPVYFTSGVYYFENTVTISGSANVVVGAGSTTGCIGDQVAAFNDAAPTDNNVTGFGATFVFGMTGRFVVNNTTAGTGPSVVFNQRFVDPSDTKDLPSASVNIMSVNGELPNSDITQTLTDLTRTGLLSVPLSIVPTTGTSFGPATADHYRPSTLVPPDPAIVPAPPDTSPIVEITLTGPTPVTVTVPGYVDVPQGRFLISIPAGSGFGTTSNITFAGGVLARTIEVPGDTASSFAVGIASVVSQLVLRIKTVTTSGTPVVTSNAVVQVNQNGAYAINNWSVG
ncbi:MAG: hypothetical protein JWM34_5235 [Ilumatobacteraceae bacterium]|nr:hypothetical protein [Ilumatobacteraceae bacterium]